MPSDVIDLGAINELKGIETNGGCITIGAMTPHAVVANSKTVRKTIPALAELASNIGDPHVRNRGTIGGSVAYNDPSADYPAALLGLDATIQTNKRAISADAFFIDIFETALKTIQERGKTKLGDKTIADSLDLIIKKLKDNTNYPEVFKSATKQALEDFKGKKILIGRARMFEDKTKSLDDPGMLALSKLAEV